MAKGTDYHYNAKMVHSFIDKKHTEIKELKILPERHLISMRLRMIDYTYRFALVLKVYSFDEKLLSSSFTDESLFVIDKETLQKALKITAFFMDQYVKAYEIFLFDFKEKEVTNV